MGKFDILAFWVEDIFLRYRPTAVVTSDRKIASSAPLHFPRLLIVSRLWTSAKKIFINT